MRSLIFADVHANLAAMEAVLNHAPAWDEVIFLGDIVIGGPTPDECISLLRTLDGIFIMGNHDEELLNLDLEREPTSEHKRWSQWTRRNVTPENLEFVRSFRKSMAVQRHGLTLRLDHGVLPPEWGKRIWPDSPDAVFTGLSQKFPEPYILLAHSHVQFRREHAGRTFINPGAVGQPRLAQPLACYGLLEDGVFSLHATPYDVEATCRAINDLPLDREFIEAWQDGYRRGVLPDIYNLRDFTPLVEQGYR